MLKVVGFDFAGVFAGDNSMENIETLRLLKRNDVPFFIVTQKPEEILFFESLYRQEFKYAAIVPTIEDGFKNYAVGRSDFCAVYIDEKSAQDPLKVRDFFYDKIGDYKNLVDYVRKVHRGKTLDDIYEGIEGKQKKLISDMVRASFKLAFNTSSLKGAAARRGNHEKIAEELIREGSNDIEIAELHNDFMQKQGFYLKIITKGFKNPERVVQKARKNGLETVEIADILRATAVGDYDCVEGFRSTLIENRSHFYDNWDMRASGVMVSGVRLNVDGVVAQVMLGEELQVEKAGVVSHDIYEVARNYDDYKVSGHESSLYTSLVKYNEFKEKFTAAASGDRAQPYDGSLGRVLGSFMVKHDIDFRFADLNENSEPQEIGFAVSDLNNLHQFIHLAYLDRANKPWQDLYSRKAEELNRVTGHEVIMRKYLPSQKHK